MERKYLLCLIRTRITTVSRITSRTGTIVSRISSRTKISRTVRTARTTVQTDKFSDFYCIALYFIFMRYGAFFVIQPNFDYKSLHYFYFQPKAAVFRAILTNSPFFILILLSHCHVDIG